jgi:hypothetical protein
MWVVFLLVLSLHFSVIPAFAESGFSEKHERHYNIFNQPNQYRPDNPLNPINAYDPKNPLNPINQYDPGNPANPMNQYNPSNPYNPLNQFNPKNPMNPLNEYDPTTPFEPLNRPLGTNRQRGRRNGSLVDPRLRVTFSPGSPTGRYFSPALPSDCFATDFPRRASSPGEGIQILYTSSL